MDSLLCLDRSQLTANNRRRKDLYTLSHADKALLDSIGYRSKLQEIDTAILANADFLHKIVANPEIFGHDVTAREDGGVEEDVELEDSERPLQRFRGQGRMIQSNSHFQALPLGVFQVMNRACIVTRTTIPTVRKH